MPDEMPEPTEDELRAALEEQMRSLRVDDVILQTVATLVNLSARRLGLAAAPGEDPADDFDLEQARTGIEAVRALLPLTPEDQVEPVRQALSQLQMAFARAAPGGGPTVSKAGEAAARQGADAGAAGPHTPDAGPADPARSQPPAAADPEEAERAKARSKIWTPPGA